MSFDIGFVETGGYEGGYSNDKNDRGGETWAGISRNNYPNLRMWKVIDALKVKNTKSVSGIPDIEKMVKDFYYEEFWCGQRCDEIDLIDPLVAHELYDSSVNCGKKNGVKFLQRALNRLNHGGKDYQDLLDDGDFGKNTMDALKICCKEATGRKLLLKCQNGEQYMYYCSLKQHELYRGWFART